ncbi:MAG: hypothetical protein K8R90_08910 [Candidatus Cloacimonetes bacterium]|nr:hypothetical protein [Candidatus Cloacimonadota bacterium]
MQRNIPAKRVIRNFVEYNRRPFNARDIVKDTGIKHKTVRNILPQLVQEGHIKVILREKQGNIYIKPPPDEDDSRGKRYDWKPKLAKLKLFYHLVGEYLHLDDIKKHTGYSQETVYRYLRILVADGCVAKFGNFFKQIEFHPTMRPYSRYSGIKEQPRMSEEQMLVLEISYLCRKQGQRPPPGHESMSKRELWDLRHQILYAATGNDK